MQVEIIETQAEGPDDIKALLPHREPFLFVDAILRADADGIVATHVFTEYEFFFQGHFPQYPVVPGVILIETMAQAGGAGLRKLGVLGGDALFFLASVDKVKFRRQVRPKEALRMEIQNLKVSAQMIKQAGKAYVGDELAAEAEWLCVVRRNP
ncbi:MAG: 3-hydroxyacyl-ACP dehydratase FabZ [Treponema sp.]|jgi:3-hydroxyacyl-[acyl-carrier-protein] dehydratase|nr:3-hydroxyacyl-ACP dehydratase FabZ [Treponema sp.]